MAEKIILSEDQTKYLNDPALTSLKKCVKEFVSDLLNEALRLEAVINTSRALPEITSSMVNDANIFMRKGYVKPKKYIIKTILKIIHILGSVFIGFLIDFEKFQVDKVALIIFIILFSVWMLSTFVVIFNDW